MMISTGLLSSLHAFAASASCTVSDVTVYSNRVHVRCTTRTVDQMPDGTRDIYYFAVPTSDAVLADRFMTVGMTALVSGRRFVVHYTSGDTSGTSFGCEAHDCRKATIFGIQ